MTRALAATGSRDLHAHEAERLDATAWGRLAPLTLVAAAGVLGVSVAYTLVQGGAWTGQPLFWLSFVLIVVPIALRLVSVEPATRERLALVVVLGLALYVARLLRSPDGFTNYDELLHLRSLADIVATGHLFADNPLLPVSPRYPALELLTAAVVQVSGADAFAAATVVLAAVRVVFVLGLFAMYRVAAGSDRVAGVATAIYMLNPNFTFFDGQFAYESLALPLVPLLLVGVAALMRPRARRSPLWIAVLAILATLAMTHHVTAFASAGLLVLWLGLRAIVARREPTRIPPLVITALAGTAAAAAWLVLVAPITLRYLAGPLEAAMTELVRLVTSGEGRALFQSATGEVAPAWERALGFGVSALLTAAIPVGLVVVWQRLRQRSLALLLAVVSLGYPLGLIGRLMPTGSEAAGRSLAVTFLGLSFVVALAVLELGDHGPDRILRRFRRLRGLVRTTVWRLPPVAGRVALAGAVASTVVAGIILGTPPATRFPGPYLVEADSRSVDAQGIDAARWLRAALGPNVRLAADRVNRLLAGSYGEADVVFHGSEGVETWQLFLSPGVGQPEIARLRQAGVRYVLIDRRLSSGLPLARFYYEEGEIFEEAHSTPVSPEVLGKWDGVPGVHRIFDSGVIQVYDVGRLSDA